MSDSERGREREIERVRERKIKKGEIYKDRERYINMTCRMSQERDRSWLHLTDTVAVPT